MEKDSVGPKCNSQEGSFTVFVFFGWEWGSKHKKKVLSAQTSKRQSSDSLVQVRPQMFIRLLAGNRSFCSSNSPLSWVRARSQYLWTRKGTQPELVYDWTKISAQLLQSDLLKRILNCWTWANCKQLFIYIYIYFIIGGLLIAEYPYQPCSNLMYEYAIITLYWAIYF